MYDIGSLMIFMVIEDYKEASPEERDEIVKAFVAKLKETQPLSATYITKRVVFRIDPSIPTEMAELLAPYSKIFYKHVQTNIQSTDSYELLKQKLLNIYERRCDKAVCFQSEYHKMLREPKRLYYRILRGHPYTLTELKERLEHSVATAGAEFDRDSAWKIDLTQEEFFRFVEDKLHQIFENYIPPDDSQSIVLQNDYIDEDHYAAAYIGRCMEYYTLDEAKYALDLRVHGTYDICPKCHSTIVDTSRHKLCVRCREGDEHRRYGTCEICGKAFRQPDKGRRAKRCRDCSEEIRRAQKREAARARRAKEKSRQ